MTERRLRCSEAATWQVKPHSVHLKIDLISFFRLIKFKFKVEGEGNRLSCGGDFVTIAAKLILIHSTQRTVTVEVVVFLGGGRSCCFQTSLTLGQALLKLN